jgi:PAS domain S-box-containing protein
MGKRQETGRSIPLVPMKKPPHNPAAVDGEERFRLIADTVPVIIWIDNTEMQCTYVNQTWFELTGQVFERALGIGWTEELHPDDLPGAMDIYARAFERREPFEMEFRLRSGGDSTRIVCRGVPRYNEGGAFAGYIGSGVDINRLADEELGAIYQRSIEAQEEEHGRIARELKEGISQRLALLGFKLNSLAQNSPDSSTVNGWKIEDACKEVADLAMGLHAISHRLHPARLDYLKFAEAAAALCHEMSSQNSVEISFHAYTDPKGLSRRNIVCLYRVLQEALRNAIKHSGEKKIEVFLRRRGGYLELSISDCGIGFDVNATQVRGLGLVSMKQRLKSVRGQLEIRSERKKGTTVQAWLPLPQDDSESS